MGLITFGPYNCTHSSLVTINGQSYIPNLNCGGIALGTGFAPNSALTLVNASYNVYTSYSYLGPCKFTATTATTKTNFECISVPDYIGLGATGPAGPAGATGPAGLSGLPGSDGYVGEVTYNLLPYSESGSTVFSTGLEDAVIQIATILSGNQQKLTSDDFPFNPEDITNTIWAICTGFLVSFLLVFFSKQIKDFFTRSF